MCKSFVIGRDRGAGNVALGTLGLLARLGLGGKVGRGTQGFSWIHENDLNHLFAHAIADNTMTGVYIASAPHPVSQATFMRTLRRVVRVPIGLPASEWMVRIGESPVLRTDPDLAIYGRYVVSKRLSQHRFTFQFPELESALRDILERGTDAGDRSVF